MPDELDPDSFELNTPADSGEQETNEEVPSLGNSFLAKIPEQDRPIVEKYVKDWDSGVTKKFQEIHGQYKPYKELGLSVEEIQQMNNFRQQLNTDPYTIYRNMTNLLKEQDGEQLTRILSEMFGDEEEYEDGDEEYEEGDVEYPDGIPPQVAEYLEQMGTKVEQFEQFMASQTQAAEEAEQFAQFDKLLEGLHTKHGDFDEELVTYQISKGASPDEAVSWYKSLVGGNSQQRRPAPSLMGSQGGVPVDQVDVTKLSGPDRRSLVEEILKSRNQ